MTSPTTRSVAEHAAVVTALIGPTAVETVTLARSRGSVVASTVHARTLLPHFDNSAVDGFAVTAADRALCDIGGRSLEVVGQINAGAGEHRDLAACSALRVMTGAPVPTDVEAIVAQERVVRDGNAITITGEIPPGLNIRRAGEEVMCGDVIARPGATMTPGLVGLCAALGMTTVEVHRPIRVAVLSTGSELFAASARAGRARPQPGEIFASNAIMLVHGVQGCGAEIVHTATVSDDPQLFLGALDRACAAADVVITSGGIGFGDHDVVKSTLHDRGVDMCTVNMRPRRPQGAGRIRDTAVVTLPGNPLAALASFEAFVRPALRTAMGYVDDGRPTLRAQLAHTIDPRPGTVRFVLGTVVLTQPRSVPVADLAAGGKGLGSVIDTNCFAFLDADRPRLAAGDLVTVTVEGGVSG